MQFRFKGKSVVCGKCGDLEDLEAAVLRSVREIQLLFPEKKITTNGVYEWCGMLVSRKRINRILRRNLNIVGVHQWAFYE
ncbi:hypothetical protein [Neobacillus endophyticus]|uniref:hypothetical protein n=1 Tax=Neobacillus endophyticus TaxID=2738405 RepID=UPI001FE2AB1B|nr:hypothetical protein [Neobacillus endophyticus]